MNYDSKLLRVEEYLKHNIHYCVKCNESTKYTVIDINEKKATIRAKCAKNHIRELLLKDLEKLLR